MSAPASAQDLLTLARTGQLIQPDQLKSFLGRHPDLPDEPRPLAELLVSEGILTKYQARHLLAGRHKGFILGSYKLLDRIGSGGMGEVYLCEHSTLRRRVAVKVLPPEKAQEPEALERFLREARAAAALDHPNIIRAYDAGRAGKSAYLVMEYVEGENLDDVIKRRGPLPYGEAADYVRQAALGLQHAYEQGLVHRDIKPGNLLLDKKGTVKILDMGLARFFKPGADDAVTKKMNGQVLGTYDYISPEQALGESNIDIRADIYSLGITFYALLTGQPPFRALNPLQKLMAHQVGELAPVHEARPQVPPGLSEVVARMTEREPDDRYQTPAEVVQALVPWLADDTEVMSVSTTPPPRGSKSSATSTTRGLPKRALRAGRRQRRQWKWLAVGAGGGLLLAVLVSAITWAVARSPDVPPTAPVADPPKAGPALPGFGQVACNEVAVSADGRRAVGIAYTEDSLAVWDVKAGKLLRKLVTGGKGRGCAISADGRRAVAGGLDMPVQLWDLDGGKILRSFEHADGVWAVAISPSGGQILSAGDDSVLRLWDATSGKLIRSFMGHDGHVWSVAFSPDGTRIVSGASRPESDVRLWDTASGQELRQFKGHTNDVRRVAFSPDGQRVASASFDGTVRLWDPVAGAVVQVIRAHDGYAEDVKFLPDGRHLVSGGAKGDVRIWEVGADLPQRTWKAHDDHVLSLTLAADGKTLVTAGRDKNVRQWLLP